MKFKFTDMPIVIVPGKLYCIYCFFNPTAKDIMSIKNACRRSAKEYTNASWFVAISETVGRGAVKSTVKTGLPGRPKTVVKGKKVRRHIHIGVIGKSSYSFQEKVRKVINKRVGRKVTKMQSMKGLGFVRYCYRQSYSFQQGGEFDFLQCKDGLFIDEYS